MTKLHMLYAAGQSVWLDFIKRDMLENGDLTDLVSNGIRGLTSNPTIFEQAIAGSDLYDERILQLKEKRQHDSTTDIFEALAVEDIQDACDALQFVYENSGGSDGFVSLEVSPLLAHNSSQTITEAHRLWNLVNRKNLMIKVPATSAGALALEELIAAGINVNATLLFSLKNYSIIAQAFVKGMNRANDPSQISSVASFFVSRVDTKADDALKKIGTSEAMKLRGTIAIANAKLAYQKYLEIFVSDDFSNLTNKGAQPQRVLWASTSTKNPNYNDVLYVDSLVGSNTVNTLPPNTIEAFVDHGSIDPMALTGNIDQATSRLDRLASLGIDFDSLTDELQKEGVAAFTNSYNDLLQTLSTKIDALQS